MSLPTNTRPDTTVGCAFADTPAGKPNAHLSSSFGTSAAVSPAPRALCERRFDSSTPQPFQLGAPEGSASGGLLVQRFGMLAAAPAFALPSGLPLMNSATPRFWTSVMAAPCACITPVVSAV